MSERRPFHRTQDPGWWVRPPYLAYTIRELTGAGVALYGGILLAGLIALTRGPAAFDGFRAFLNSPLALLIHVLLLATMLWHVVTWFQTMPKTMPKLIVSGRHVPQGRLALFGMSLAALCSFALLAFAIGLLS